MKILTIGNSFTDSLNTYFQKVVESCPGCTLHFERANHGGCELHRHWSYICNEEADGVYRMYQDYKYKMRELLAKERWDVVTIQQASHFSWRPETYQPFAGHIVNYVRKHAPQAEILIQQTWAYRVDDPRLLPEGVWDYSGFDQPRAAGIRLPAAPVKANQRDMYAALTAAYRTLSRDLALRIIPTGYAVQLTRENEPVPFKNYAPELLATLKWPDLPPQTGDVVGSMWWQKNAQMGELEIGRDTIHLNRRGEYLQACVWFAFLYGHRTGEIRFVPEELSDADARFLRDLAQRAVDEFKQEF